MPGHRDPRRAALAAPALRRALAAAGRAQLRIEGHSMRPLLRAGCVVSLRPVSAGESLRGAVVAIAPPPGEIVIVHRVVSIAPGHVVTQGITSRRLDPPTRLGDVIGVICRVHGRPRVVGGERGINALAAASAALVIALRWLGALR